MAVKQMYYWYDFQFGAWQPYDAAGAGTPGAGTFDARLASLGVDARAGTMAYFQPGSAGDVPGLAQNAGYNVPRLNNLGAFCNRVSGRTIQLTYDSGPAHVNVSWANNASEAVAFYGSITNAHWDAVLAGTYDAAFRTWVDWLIAAGLNRYDIPLRIDHECSAYWYTWSICVNPSKFSAQWLHKVQVMQAHGLLNKVGMDCAPAAGCPPPSQYITPSIWALPNLALDFDMYVNSPGAGAWSDATGVALTNAIAMARANPGVKVDICEGGMIHGADDAAGVAYFTWLESHILAATDVFDTFCHWMLGPETTTTQYAGTGAIDYMNNPAGFTQCPSTKNRVVTSFDPHLWASTSTTPTPPPPAGGGGSTLALVSQTVTGAYINMVVTAATRVTLWQSGGVQIDTQTPDSTGAVHFGPLLPGTYFPVITDDTTGTSISTAGLSVLSATTPLTVTASGGASSISVQTTGAQWIDITLNGQTTVLQGHAPDGSGNWTFTGLGAGTYTVGAYDNVVTANANSVHATAVVSPADKIITGIDVSVPNQVTITTSGPVVEIRLLRNGVQEDSHAPDGTGAWTFMQIPAGNYEAEVF